MAAEVNETRPRLSRRARRWPGAWARAARLCASLKFGCLIVVLLFLAWAAGLALWQELSS